MTTAAEKRRKQTGRRPATFLGIRYDVLDSEQWQALSGSQAKLLIDLARQYNGYNNGNLCPAILPRKCGPWKSRATRSLAVAGCVEAAFLVKTKQGGLGLGPDLYAITWWAIDHCKGKHSAMPEMRASDLWKKKTPYRIPVLAVPDSGHQPVSAVPDSGPVKGVSRAA